MEEAEFEIRESQEGGWLRLTLVGELDMASAPVLKERLGQLRREGHDVLMDLSRLAFMDSTGLEVVIQSINASSREGWRLSIDSNLAPQVGSLFKLTNLDRFLRTDRTDE
ncbi:MAG: STAS domain-containing protein [Solirubrobacteraceae bacterium]